MTEQKRYHVMVFGMNNVDGKVVNRRYIVYDPIQASSLARDDGIHPARVNNYGETDEEIDERLRKNPHLYLP